MLGIQPRYRRSTQLVWTTQTLSSPNFRMPKSSTTSGAGGSFLMRLLKQAPNQHPQPEVPDNYEFPHLFR